MKTVSLSTILVLLLLVSACKKHTTTPAKETRSKEHFSNNTSSHPVILDNLKTVWGISSYGIVSTESELKLGFKTGGIIQWIIDEGTYVKKDDILASLDMTEVSARVNQARNARDKAHRDLERGQALFKDSIVTLEQLQNLTTQYELAQSNYKVALFNKKHSIIKAPSDGIIVKSFANSSEIIGKGRPALVFGAQNQSKIVKLGLPEKDILHISNEDPVKIQIISMGNRTFEARVINISEAPDQHTGTYEVEVLISPNDDINRLKKGFLAEAVIFPKNQHQYYKIPFEAISATEKSRVLVSIENSRGQSAAHWLNTLDIADDGIIAYKKKQSFLSSNETTQSEIQ